MNDNEATPSSSPPRRQPWNKGKLIGAKPPLRASYVWSIRTKLQLEKRTRDLALFNLAIDGKLRGCDVVEMRVDDVAPNGYTLDRATIRQKKTGRPVRFELTEQTRQAIDEYLRLNGRKPGEFLFAGRAVATAMASQHVNMLAWLVSGSRASASTRRRVSVQMRWCRRRLRF
jgi:integrase